VPGSRTEFIVTPLNFAYGKPITKNAHTVNRGVTDNDQLNDKNKDLKAWTKLIPGATGNDNYLTSLQQNSTLLAGGLEQWIDSTSKCGWKVESTCGSDPTGTFTSTCSNSPWSTLYPDPKSELIPVNEHGRIR
jgi:protein xylosyltransferase